MQKRFKKILFFLSLILPCSVSSLELPFNQNGSNRVGHLRLEMERPIDQSTFLYIKFALEHFEKVNCSSIILDLDTPGGEVFSAQKISNLLKNSSIPVVAYINNWAISAGAMLAYSCPYIVTTKSSSMGAAEPVMIKNQSMESAPEKVKSALRSEFSNLANYYGRNPEIAMAMVDQDIFLVKREGKVISLKEKDEIRKEDDEIVSLPGKLLTLNGKDLVELNISDHLSEDLFSEIYQLELVEFNNWKIDLFSFLSHPLVSSILMMGLMLGFYLEIQMGGFGIPALIGLFCLALILLSHFAISLTNYLELIFIIAGALLILSEFFLFPTLGVGAGVGLLLFLVGLFTLSEPSWREIEISFGSFDGWNLAAFSAIRALGWLSFSILASLLLMVVFSRLIFPKTKLFKLFVPDDLFDKPIFTLPSVGSHGIAFSAMRPQGQVEIDGTLFEAQSIGGFIDKGEKVMIVSHEMNRIIIRPIDG